MAALLRRFESSQYFLQFFWVHGLEQVNGQVVVIDFHRILGKTRVWLLYHVRAGQEVVVKEIESSGFKKVGEEPFLSENYLVRFEKVERKEPMLIQPEDLQKKLKEAGLRVLDTRTEELASPGQEGRRLPRRQC